MEKFDMNSLMKDIENGLFDDLINAEIEANEKQMCEAGTPEYIEWVMKKINESDTSSLFDDDENIKEQDKLLMLPSLYSYLVNMYGLIPKHTESENGFEKSSVYFKYKGKVYEMVQSFCETNIITGIAKSKFRGETEELVF